MSPKKTSWTHVDEYATTRAGFRYSTALIRVSCSALLHLLLNTDDLPSDFMLVTM